ncbi:hypothetical protein V2J09_024011 [Rumex salicifolius]
MEQGKQKKEVVLTQFEAIVFVLQSSFAIHKTGSIIMSSLAWFFKAAILLIVVQISFLPEGLSSSSNDDKITSLPGQPPVKFNRYAGYVTVDDTQQRSLLYYFVESETDPQTKPLVLWLNGGPGCSSLSGVFSRKGPFIPKGKVLMRNHFSWNQVSGWSRVSYSSNKSFYSFTNDEITARDDLKFIFGWFEKYPEYQNREFFISGGSYAGHYVPQLANLILETRLKSNLKGIIADFFWSHGAISNSTYTMLNTICNLSQIFRQFMDGNISPACVQEYNQGIEEIGNFIDMENVLISNFSGEESSCSFSSFSSSDPFCLKFVWKLWKQEDACLQLELQNYLNRKDVQETIHAKLVGVNQWSYCTNNSDIGYNLQDSLVPTFPLLGHLVKSGVRVMVFSGDQDGKIPFMGTKSLIRALAEHLGMNTSVPYRSWLQDKQVGGWTQYYDRMLSFATVRGGGHDSSFTRPKTTLFLFKCFIKGMPLPVAKAN